MEQKWDDDRCIDEGDLCMKRCGGQPRRSDIAVSLRKMRDDYEAALAACAVEVERGRRLLQEYQDINWR